MRLRSARARSPNHNDRIILLIHRLKFCTPSMMAWIARRKIPANVRDYKRGGRNSREVKDWGGRMSGSTREWLGPGDTDIAALGDPANSCPEPLLVWLGLPAPEEVFPRPFKIPR